MPETDLPPLDILLLVRTACARGGRVRRAELKRAVEPYLVPWAGPRERARRLARAWPRIEAIPDPEAAALALLERTALPRRRAWPGVRDTELVARAIGLPIPRGRDRDRFRTADGLRAALLRQAHDLPLPIWTTPTAVAKSLAWKRLARLLDRPLPPAVGPRCGSGAVIEVLLSDWLADGRRRTLPRALAALAAEVAGAATPDAPSLRRALLTRWVRDAEAELL